MKWAGIPMLALVAVCSTNAVAGPYSDELDKCLISSATDKDQADLVRWVFAAVARSEDLREIFPLPPEQNEKLTRAAAKVMERLFTKDCRSQFLNAARKEGDAAPGAGIGSLTQAAIARVMKDPAVADRADELGRFINWNSISPAEGSTKPAEGK